MENKVLKMVFFILLLISLSIGENSDLPLRYDEPYAKGVNAYYNDEWLQVIENMNHAVRDYKEISKAREKCFDECRDQTVDIPPDYTEDNELHFYHGVVQRATCIQKCKGTSHDDEVSSSYKMEQNLELGEVYNYIQISLFKENRIPEAVSYATTHSYLDPHASSAQANLQFYEARNDIPKEHFKPLERKAYRDLYEEGQSLYNEEKFEEMVEKFELSLKELYIELEKCRTSCEGLMQFKDSLELSKALSSLYISVLECKHSCLDKLGGFRQDYDNINFLGSYFHHLQYGYFKINQVPKAVQALTTHRRIEPKNEIARMNAAYMKQLPGITQKNFVEREDSKPLLDKLEEENKLIEILRRFSRQLDEGEDKKEEEDKNDMTLLEEDFKSFPVIVGEEETKDQEEMKDQEEPRDQEKEDIEEQATGNMTILETPANHSGIERIVADGVLTPNQCRQLLDLAQNCIEGDGYPQKSPHTVKEKFEGLTVISAAKAAVRREANQTNAKLYLNASRKVKEVLAEQFNLEKELYFSFTHLVCRTAKEGMQDERKDLSHPVHSDNCYLNETLGECIKQPPAFTWRDYSAILYLNDEFEGGQFFFAHSPKDLSPQHYVIPKCGRMVGFSAGGENMHGVKAITKGKRCVVALWFTHDLKYKELSFDHAETLLSGAH